MTKQDGGDPIGSPHPVSVGRFELSIIFAIPKRNNLMVSRDGLCDYSNRNYRCMNTGLSGPCLLNEDVLLAHRSTGEPDLWTPGPTPFLIQEGA